jgi:protein-L-isoaspartate(D-aspartate) O-methyltransferase
MDKISIEQARFNMIEQQIRPAEVLDPKVLAAISTTPREHYVPQKFRELAFADTEVPLENGQCMMKPILEGRILQALEIKPSDKILEIGTGSGYLTALLAKLGQQVVSLEIYESLFNQANKLLSEQNIDNATLHCSDGCRGWAEDAPYDVIAVTGSVPIHTDVFENQLKVGGRLVVIEGSQPVQSFTLVTCVGEQNFQRENLFETVVPPLENVDTPEAFSF